MWTPWTTGISGDKNRMMTGLGGCPWKADCPSHKPFVNARKPKLRLVERVQPHVYKWQCSYCGLSFFGDESGFKKEEESRPFVINPALIGGGLKI